MVNIRSLKDSSESEIRRKRIGGIVIIALLLLSTIGFALSIVGFGGNANQNIEDTQGFSYNGQYWVYTSGLQKYYFTHNVKELNYSFSLSKSLADFGNKHVYVDSEIVGGLQEVYNNLGLYAGKISEVCYGSCDKDLPEKNCSSFEPFIVIREDKIESITESESCIFVNGSMRTIDSLLYKILGIN